MLAFNIKSITVSKFVLFSSSTVDEMRKKRSWNHTNSTNLTLKQSRSLELDLTTDLVVLPLTDAQLLPSIEQDEHLSTVF